MRYQSRNPCEAFVFGSESEYTGPDWFVRAVRDGKIEINRSLVDGAVYVYGCSIIFGRNKVIAKNGDYIVLVSPNVMIPFKPNDMGIIYERKVESLACKGSGGKKGKGGGRK